MKTNRKRQKAGICLSWLAVLVLWPFAIVYADSVTGSQIDRGDAHALLAHHNQERAVVDVPPLQWSTELARYAQQWTDHLAQGGCQLQHRSGSSYGENLFMGTAGHYRPVDGSRRWASEKQYYDGGVLRPDNWYPSGHYTQMVWRDTTTMGCGQSECRGNVIVACNYSPPGNVMGQKPY